MTGRRRQIFTIPNHRERRRGRSGWRGGRKWVGEGGGLGGKERDTGRK